MPTVTVPKSGFDKPTFAATRPPDGSYTADVQEIFVSRAESGAAWINTVLVNFETLEGETTANEVDLTTQVRRFDNLILMKNGEVPAWAYLDNEGKAGRVTRLAVALGVVEADAGDFEFPDDPDALAEMLQQGVGARVRCYLKNKPRQRNGEVVMRDDGAGPVVDATITSVDRLD